MANTGLNYPEQTKKVGENGYRGIIMGNRKKWVVRFSYKGKRISLGIYYRLIDAIKAYDDFSIKTYGENAFTNQRLIDSGLAPLPTTEFDHPINKIEDLPGEIWKDIEGYDGYYKVSTRGRVKSLYHISPNSKEFHEILRAHTTCRGYLTIPLWKNNKQNSVRLNRLVAIAFIPNPFNLSDVHHKDYNKLNNNIENLEWMSGLDNYKDARAKGRWTKKPKGNPKITPEQAREIKILRRDKKYNVNELAKMFGLKPKTIYEIAAGKRRWKEIII